jgi:hypothetical protein
VVDREVTAVEVVQPNVDDKLPVKKRLVQTNMLELQKGPESPVRLHYVKRRSQPLGEE